MGSSESRQRPRVVYLEMIGPAIASDGGRITTEDINDMPGTHFSEPEAPSYSRWRSIDIRPVETFRGDSLYSDSPDEIEFSFRPTTGTAHTLASWESWHANRGQRVSYCLLGWGHRGRHVLLTPRADVFYDTELHEIVDIAGGCDERFVDAMSWYFSRSTHDRTPFEEDHINLAHEMRYEQEMLDISAHDSSMAPRDDPMFPELYDFRPETKPYAPGMSASDEVLLNGITDMFARARAARWEERKKTAYSFTFWVLLAAYLAFIYLVPVSGPIKALPFVDPLSAPAFGTCIDCTVPAEWTYAPPLPSKAAPAPRILLLPAPPVQKIPRSAGNVRVAPSIVVRYLTLFVSVPVYFNITLTRFVDRPIEIVRSILNCSMCPRAETSFANQTPTPPQDPVADYGEKLFTAYSFILDHPAAFDVAFCVLFIASVCFVAQQFFWKELHAAASAVVCTFASVCSAARLFWAAACYIVSAWNTIVRFRFHFCACIACLFLMSHRDWRAKLVWDAILASAKAYYWLLAGSVWAAFRLFGVSYDLNGWQPVTAFLAIHAAAIVALPILSDPVQYLSTPDLNNRVGVVLARDKKGVHRLIYRHMIGQKWMHLLTGSVFDIAFTTEAKVSPQSDYKVVPACEHQVPGIALALAHVPSPTGPALHDCGHISAHQVLGGPLAGDYLLSNRHVFEGQESANHAQPPLTATSCVVLRRRNKKGVYVDLEIDLSLWTPLSGEEAEFVGLDADLILFKAPTHIYRGNKQIPYSPFAQLQLPPIQFKDMSRSKEGPCFIQAYNVAPNGTTYITESNGAFGDFPLIERKRGLILHTCNTEPGHSGSPIWIRRPNGRKVMVALHTGSFGSGPDGKPWNAAITMPALEHFFKKVKVKEANGFLRYREAMALITGAIGEIRTDNFVGEVNHFDYSGAIYKKENMQEDREYDDEPDAAERLAEHYEVSDRSDSERDDSQSDDERRDRAEKINDLADRYQPDAVLERSIADRIKAGDGEVYHDKEILDARARASADAVDSGGVVKSSSYATKKAVQAANNFRASAPPATRRPPERNWADMSDEEDYPVERPYARMQPESKTLEDELSDCRNRRARRSLMQTKSKERFTSPYIPLRMGVDCSYKNRYYASRWDRPDGAAILRPLDEIRSVPICDPAGRLDLSEIIDLIDKHKSLDYAGYAQQWLPSEILAHPEAHIYNRYRDSGKIDFSKTREVLSNRKGEPMFENVGTTTPLPSKGSEFWELDEDFMAAARANGVELAGADGRSAYVRPQLTPDKLRKTLKAQAMKMEHASWDALGDKALGREDLYEDFPTTSNPSWGDLDEWAYTCMATMDDSKSNGYAGHMRPGPKATYMDEEGYAALLSIAMVKALVMVSLGPRAIGSMSPEELVFYGVSDPKTIFGKNEMIPRVKDEADIVRTIWPYSTPQNYLTSLIHRKTNKEQISAYQTGRCSSLLIGAGHSDAGIMQLGKAFNKILHDPKDGGKGKGFRVKDCSAYDFTIVRDAQMTACGARIATTRPLDEASLCKEEFHYFSEADQFDPEQLAKFGLSQTFAVLMHCVDLLEGAHCCVIGCFLYVATKAGITGSGSSDTSSTNSMIQCLAHRLCGARRNGAGGDDSVSRIYDSWDAELYAALGFIVKPGSAEECGPLGPVKYNSHKFTRETEDSDWTASYENIEKLISNSRFFLQTPASLEEFDNLQRCGAYREIMRNLPGMWEKFVAMYACVGIIIPDVEARITDPSTTEVSPFIDEESYDFLSEMPAFFAPEGKYASIRIVSSSSCTEPVVDDRIVIADQQVAALLSRIRELEAFIKPPPGLDGEDADSSCQPSKGERSGAARSRRSRRRGASPRQ